MSVPVLAAAGLTKRFGGLTAVDSLDFEIAEGEIVGLIGPNGSGKTTVMNLIMGTFAPNAGEARFLGRSINGLPPHQRVRLGMARTFQIPQPYLSMTAVENVAMAAMYGQASPKSVSTSIDLARELLDFIGVGALARREAASLPTRDLKLLDLARALATEPKVLLLDELLAGVTPGELPAIVALIRRINERGVTILFIEHLMKAVMGVSSRVIVLDRGKKLAEGTPDEIASDEQVVAAYLGPRYKHVRAAGPSIATPSSPATVEVGDG